MSIVSGRVNFVKPRERIIEFDGTELIYERDYNVYHDMSDMGRGIVLASALYLKQYSSPGVDSKSIIYPV